MPFTKHIIEPTSIAQCPLPSGEPNELECLSNLTLANVIRQLSSVGEHACRIFAELSAQAQELTQRSEQMGKRIEQLGGKCAQLDIQNEELCVNDQLNKKQFKSASKIEQQVVSRRTMPEAMRILYESADPPPSLEKLNPYRTDGKDCLKFYTDPEFFFNIWCNELIKDNEARKIEKKRRKTRNENPNVTTRPAGGMKPTGHQQASEHQMIHLPSTSLPIDPNLQMLMLMQQQQKAMQHQQMINHYDPYNPAKQILLMSGQPNQFNASNQQQQVANQMDAINEETMMMMQLPPPPASLQVEQNNYQVYAESHSMNNGARLSKMSVQHQHQQQNRNSTERPVFPPPPVPDQNVSDLQQIMRKFTIANDINGDSSNNNGATEGLPPPPSPPDFTELNLKVGVKMNMRESHQYNNHVVQESTSYQADSIMMSLPPPPMDLIAPNGPVGAAAPPPPPPPPIPPLSTQPPPSPPPPPPDNESLTSNNIQQPVTMPTTQVTASSASKGTTEVSNNSRSFLNDINEGRFTLKPTQRNEILNSSGLDSSRRKATSMQEENSSSSKSNSLTGHGASRATLEPFVNNSDVAAIIDFVRKFRPHVCHSSDDEDETGSDWDD